MSGAEVPSARAGNPLFGAPRAEHDQRYDYVQEWLKIIQRLWAEDREFDHDGGFCGIRRGSSMPNPEQRRGPPIANAGGSDRDQQSPCQFADISFLVLRSEQPLELVTQIDSYKRMATDMYKREVQVPTYAYYVQRPTRAEAWEYLEHHGVRNEDGPGLDAWNAGGGAQTGILRSPEAARALRRRFAAGAGGSGLVGTASDVAERLEQLTNAGLDGVLETWADFSDGLRRFTEVMPQLERDGLRKSFTDLSQAGPD